MDERIEVLETRLTYQERSIAELSAGLFDAAKRIDRLERLGFEMASKVKELSEAGEASAPGDVRPPHW
jgi:uncharacterized coiled-coil protein SlyX